MVISAGILWIINISILVLEMTLWHIYPVQTSVILIALWAFCTFLGHVTQWHHVLSAIYRILYKKYELLAQLLWLTTRVNILRYWTSWKAAFFRYGNCNSKKWNILYGYVEIMICHLVSLCLLILGHMRLNVGHLSIKGRQIVKFYSNRRWALYPFFLY